MKSKGQRRVPEVGVENSVPGGGCVAGAKII